MSDPTEPEPLSREVADLLRRPPETSELVRRAHLRAALAEFDAERGADHGADHGEGPSGEPRRPVAARHRLLAVAAAVAALALGAALLIDGGTGGDTARDAAVAAPSAEARADDSGGEDTGGEDTGGDGTGAEGAAGGGDLGSGTAADTPATTIPPAAAVAPGTESTGDAASRTQLDATGSEWIELGEFDTPDAAREAALAIVAAGANGASEGAGPFASPRDVGGGSNCPLAPPGSTVSLVARATVLGAARWVVVDDRTGDVAAHLVDPVTCATS